MDLPEMPLLNQPPPPAIDMSAAGDSNLSIPNLSAMLHGLTGTVSGKNPKKSWTSPPLSQHKTHNFILTPCYAICFVLIRSQLTSC